MFSFVKVRPCIIQICIPKFKIYDNTKIRFFFRRPSNCDRRNGRFILKRSIYLYCVRPKRTNFLLHATLSDRTICQVYKKFRIQKYTHYITKVTNSGKLESSQKSMRYSYFLEILQNTQEYTSLYQELLSEMSQTDKVPKRADTVLFI